MIENHNRLYIHIYTVYTYTFYIPYYHTLFQSLFYSQNKRDRHHTPTTHVTDYCGRQFPHLARTTIANNSASMTQRSCYHLLFSPNNALFEHGRYHRCHSSSCVPSSLQGSRVNLHASGVLYQTLPLVTRGNRSSLLHEDTRQWHLPRTCSTSTSNWRREVVCP